ncbi:OmpA-OmpF porin, OOP family [Massilia yuzhufengensis]|uniref:OmpA-OmpF porin, OOP family n=2 Tax=Massilia yuzhufengensis TaxID=1164594 RepID=A0A1I1LL01_9BURK|nr:OmpA-OmpF porin, OOP family [Massilia yuzhufengensis]
MKISRTLPAMIALACATMMSANAQDMAPQQPVQADSAFVNPDWANSAWYMGAGVGRTRAKIYNSDLARRMSAAGLPLTGYNVDNKDVGYKLFVGKQINKYLAVELGYFDLGEYSFEALTTANRSLRGETDYRGVNLDLVGMLPLTERFSLLGRAGVQYAKARTDFTGNALNAVTNPNPPTEGRRHAKLGLGAEYKLTEALALRAEVERYRVTDAVQNSGNIHMASLSLTYKFGRPAKVAYVAPAAPVAAPVQEAPVAAPTPPAPEPVPTSEKVSIAAEALFDFDKSIVKPEGKAALDEFMAKLQGMNTEVMIAVGHTDSVGTNAYNDKLSMRRADAVKAYMVSKGLDPARLYTEGKGETQPVADNATAEGRAKNRRVTIEVVGTRTTQR